MKRFEKLMIVFVVLARIILSIFYFEAITTFFTEPFGVNKHMEYGSVGRDTVYVLGNGKFQISNTAGARDLIMYRDDDGTIETLLRRVSKYKKVKGSLYVIGDTGYGVVDGKTNTCKLFITVPKDEFIGMYSTDSEGNVHITSAFVEDEHVQYIESFDDFSENEKKIFVKLEAK